MRLLTKVGRVLALSLWAAFFLSPADASEADGVWLLKDKVAIRISDCGRQVCGQVVWLHNPALRTREMCGRRIIWGLTQNGPSDWGSGQIFDPDNGTTYDLAATMDNADVIVARIYKGLEVFGETKTLVRIEPGSLPGWC